jgi:hypothetical protein
MTFRRTSYRSVRAPGLSDEALLRELAAPSQERNRNASITSCLWFSHHTFVQVLEGAASAVGELMARLATDRRHAQMVVFANTEARVRVFDRWPLKCVRSYDCPEVDQLSAPAHTPHPMHLIAARGHSQPGVLSSAAVLQIIGALVCAEPTPFTA